MSYNAFIRIWNSTENIRKGYRIMIDMLSTGTRYMDQVADESLGDVRQIKNQMVAVGYQHAFIAEHASDDLSSVYLPLQRKRDVIKSWHSPDGIQ